METTEFSISYSNKLRISYKSIMWFRRSECKILPKCSFCYKLSDLIDFYSKLFWLNMSTYDVDCLTFCGQVDTIAIRQNSVHNFHSNRCFGELYCIKQSKIFAYGVIKCSDTTDLFNSVRLSNICLGIPLWEKICNRMSEISVPETQQRK